MEHITTKTLPNGMVQLTPEVGYMLFSEKTRTTHSEAVVKEGEVKYFTAVKKGENS